MSEAPTESTPTESDDAAPEPSSRTSRALMAALLVLALFVGFAGWKLWEQDRAAAVGCLRTLNVAQAIYREGGRDPSGELLYAPSLEALEKANLIDNRLGSGDKAGYLFEVQRGSGTNAPYIWSAIARPKIPLPWSMKALYTDQSGVIYLVEPDSPITAGKLPPGAKPL